MEIKQPCTFFGYLICPEEEGMSQEEGKFTDNSKDFGPDDEQAQNVSMESADNTKFQGHSESDIVKSQHKQKEHSKEDSKEKDKKSGKKNKNQKYRYKVKCTVLEEEKKNLEEQLEAARRIKPEQEPCNCITRQNVLPDENDTLKKETEKLSKEISELKTDVSKLSQEKEEYVEKLIANEQEVKSVQEAYKLEKDQFEKLIQEKDKKIQGLTSDSVKKDSMLKKHVMNIGNLENDLKKLQQTNAALRNINVNQSEAITALNQEKEALNTEKKNLLMSHCRLSKCAGDNLTYQNPSIADLSDEKRPTKLAEEFSELYDNEWTDAFEEANIENEQGITAFMLQLLKRANELCNEVSENHAESIKQSFSSITVKSHVPKGHLNGRMSLNTQPNPGTSSKTGPDVAQETLLEAVKDLGKPQNGSENEEAGSSEWNDNTLTETAGRGVEIVQGPALPQNSQERNDDEEPKRKRMKLESDFELLRKEQKKTIMEARKFFELQLSEEVERAGSDIIVQELGIDQQKQGTVVSYIKKCMNICWSMCRHEPPVYVEFIDVGDNIPFDTNKYKPYTKSGKLLDYIVWPAVYLHKDGPMLAKGVAQGKA
ncbi:myosin heavy chain, striated muscle-like isoform X6 [Mercenaria mercenaria]|uniref:myosin heavy chain, striated muscle-like isoform X6 n=1 Tax=Mercenaria mercenaria TaxID=6596 RepID=UPI00234F1A82|nr:myosin heavy chain, striated muscle-like isoform X6 [Mercenaria mercenaria]